MSCASSLWLNLWLLISRFSFEVGWLTRIDHFRADTVAWTDPFLHPCQGIADVVRSSGFDLKAQPIQCKNGVGGPRSAGYSPVACSSSVPLRQRAGHQREMLRGRKYVK